MNLLISTATNTITIIEFNDEKIISFNEITSNNNHTQYLYNLLNTSNIDINKIEQLFVINGPGSFTGLRVGITFAKTIALEKNIPITPINYLELLYSIYKKNIALDARGKKYYYYDGISTQIIENSNIAQNTLIDPILINDKKIIKFLINKKSTTWNNISINYVKNPL